MERELDYTNPLLDNYRTATHDAIMLYAINFMVSFPRTSREEHWKRNSQLKMVWGEKLYLTKKKIVSLCFSSWGTWSGCTKSCGGGIQTRSRSCSIDSSNYNDANRPLTEQQSCNNLNCPGKIKWVFLDEFLGNLIIQCAFVWPQVKTEPFVTMHALMLVPKTGLAVKLHSNIIGKLLQPCQEASEYLNIALTNLTLLMI